MAVTIPPSAQAIIDRLAAMDYAHPVIDRPVVEQALMCHLDVLGQPRRPVRWQPDAECAYVDVAHLAGQAGRAARVAAWAASGDAAWAAAGDAARAAAWDAVRAAAWDAVWAAAGVAAWDAARDAAWDAARAAVGVAAWDAARVAARDAAWDAARVAAWDAARDAAWDAARDAAWDAAGDAAGAAARAAAGDAAGRYADICRPFVDAFEAGLWLYWVRPSEVVAVPRPALHVMQNRLHRVDGPAVWWPDGPQYFFWRGVRVTERIIMQCDRLTGQEIMKERNAEVRRAMIEKIGTTRFFDLVGNPKPIHTDDTGELYRIALKDDPEPLVAVRVKDPSTGRVYLLRVPPTITRAREGVAWSFAMNEETWIPTVET